MKIVVNEKLKPASVPTRRFDPFKLSDEDYHDTLAIHAPIWGYIIHHYRKEHQCPLIILGRDSLPIAIELSQWDYPIYYLAEDLDAVTRAKSDCVLHAGDTQRFFSFNFLKNCPQGRVVAFTSLSDKILQDMIVPYFSMLLRGCREIVFSIHINDYRLQTLSSNFQVNVKRYPRNPYLFVSVREYEN